MKTKYFMIVLALCISVPTINAQSKKTQLKNGKKIIPVVENQTKNVLDILPADALPNKSIASKKCPSCTYFKGMLYGDSSRSVRPYEFSDIAKRKFLSIKETKNFSIVPHKDAMLTFDLSQAYTLGDKFLFRDYVIEKPDYNFTQGNQFLVMFDAKRKQVLLKVR